MRTAAWYLLGLGAGLLAVSYVLPRPLVIEGEPVEPIAVDDAAEPDAG